MSTVSISRPKAKSLHIPIPEAKQWNKPQPATPRRSTYPQMGGSRKRAVHDTELDAPPVPVLSYWEPETPKGVTSPLSPISPHNPFLYSPSSTSPRAMFPTASPVLPASPLSIFGCLSPMTPSFLFPRTLPVPMSPRYNASRRQSVFTSRQDTQLVQRRHSAVWSATYTEPGQAPHESMSKILVAVREKIVTKMASKQKAGKPKSTWSVTGKKRTDTCTSSKRKGFKTMKQVLTCV